ncbi:UDP-N-acetylmuramoyl-tripeptide--D-alanyl-D-alanine ligase [Acidipila rosea]|uniref:UDP-N-acetylmuramoyl-tripeptide--D-alanyl-D-alanine ligase n=1 Tax=Acidipila rosea TaxID=768535 RepID=A0A4V2PVM6_9BACT|nr:UDP-N-acetylmuramoyl-tripeptide--D-alanyl-D-alanine ligase [Acidipila rosea]TCK74361.1 UDP-N-acetylmuramoyl-tripeptide--D-alanyl-D-alanine ligase [Acidipila rosea]
MNLDLATAALEAGGKLRLPGKPIGELIATGYSIDSRTMQAGELFFAVRGERFDGHDFIEAAFAREAVAAVVAESQLLNLPERVRSLPLIVVDDPLLGLQRLAAYVRRHWGRLLIGITGSAGKTTTKDAIAAVLSMKCRVLKSQGNLNNGFGLPLQLLKLDRALHDVAVIEMGMSNAGEITMLARIASPDWAVVTNVGNAHAQNFPDGIAGVARAKYELVADVSGRGKAFLNCDDAYVSQFGRDFQGEVIYFGSGPCGDPRAFDVVEHGADGVTMHVHAGTQEQRVQLKLMGRHNVTNALAAIAVGTKYGVPLADCALALASLEPGDKRGQMVEFHGAKLINDSYNCNPEALKAMIRTLAAVPATRRILVAGEMLELGPDSRELHRACGVEAAANHIDIVLGVRGEAARIVEAAAESGLQAIFLETPEAAGAWLKANLRPGDVALLKASRGVKLERALAELATE